MPKTNMSDIFKSGDNLKFKPLTREDMRKMAVSIARGQLTNPYLSSEMHRRASNVLEKLEKPHERFFREIGEKISRIRFDVRYFLRHGRLYDHTQRRVYSETYYPQVPVKPRY